MQWSISRCAVTKGMVVLNSGQRYVHLKANSHDAIRSNSSADKWHLCCNFAKNGKGAKFGTNEAGTIQIKNQLGGILKISKF